MSMLKTGLTQSLVGEHKSDRHENFNELSTPLLWITVMEHGVAFVAYFSMQYMAVIDVGASWRGLISKGYILLYSVTAACIEYFYYKKMFGQRDVFKGKLQCGIPVLWKKFVFNIPNLAQTLATLQASAALKELNDTDRLFRILVFCANALFWAAACGAVVHIGLVVTWIVIARNSEGERADHAAADAADAANLQFVGASLRADSELLCTMQRSRAVAFVLIKSGVLVVKVFALANLASWGNSLDWRTEYNSVTLALLLSIYVSLQLLPSFARSICTSGQRTDCGCTVQLLPCMFAFSSALLVLVNMYVVYAFKVLIELANDPRMGVGGPGLLSPPSLLYAKQKK